ncbi:MAG TPA: hypothetical protein VMV84_02960 [Dehalococcoidales bacterium]|nr:hypothetical protein [Dehalococcoidales bacterium]
MAGSNPREGQKIKIPTTELQNVYKQWKGLEPTGFEWVDQTREYYIGLLRKELEEREALPSNPGRGKISLPKLPGQKEPPKLWPPTLPETTVPTPFGKVHLPSKKLELPKLPPFDEKSRGAMKHAIGIDLSLIPAMIPWVGDVVADVVEDLHFAELRKVLTPGQYDEFIQQDKIAPATIAMARALTKEN